RFGHTSRRLSFPVISRILLAITIFHVGTPAKLVTFSFTVICAIRSIFSSKFGFKVTSRLGVRLNSAQKGRFRIRIDDKSPEYESGLKLLICEEPPMTTDFPVNTLLSGLLWQ